jgi:cysteine desulfurase
MPQTIYLDHAATTPLDSRVWDAMQPYLTEHFGNPSSIYRLGRQARKGLDEARQTVADILNASPQEIVFTSSGTEADNLAIKGVAEAMRQQGRGRHIITSAIEHHAVLHPCEYLETMGFAVTYLPVDEAGGVQPQVLAQAIRPDTVLVTIMAANNEIGTIEPLDELAQVTREHGVYLHTDAVQAGGYLSLDVEALGVDLLSLSAHKIYGPKGAGVLYVRRGVPLTPLIHGGGQERGRRSSTENVAGIVGLAEALRLAQEERESYQTHCLALREQLIEGILSRIPGAQLNGHRKQRLPNNVHFCFAGISGEAILVKLDQLGICASSGSACNVGVLEPSHVLKALGVPDELALSALRLSLGRGNTLQEVAYVLEVLPRTIVELRESGLGDR